MSWLTNSDDLIRVDRLLRTFQKIDIANKFNTFESRKTIEIRFGFANYRFYRVWRTYADNES